MKSICKYFISTITYSLLKKSCWNFNTQNSKSTPVDNYSTWTTIMANHMQGNVINGGWRNTAEGQNSAT